MYNKDEILKVAQMYNRVMEAMNDCKEANTATNYDGDYMFVECVNGTHYTNELGDIMPNDMNGEFYTCESMEETAAKYTELCLKNGNTPADIYTAY